MTRAAFLAYLEQGLRPTLKRGDIVIFDNLPAHKGVAVENAIKTARARLSISRNTRPISIQSNWPSAN